GVDVTQPHAERAPTVGISRHPLNSTEQLLLLACEATHDHAPRKIRSRGHSSGLISRGERTHEQLTGQRPVRLTGGVHGSHRPPCPGAVRCGCDGLAHRLKSGMPERLTQGTCKHLLVYLMTVLESPHEHS